MSLWLVLTAFVGLSACVSTGNGTVDPISHPLVPVVSDVDACRSLIDATRAVPAGELDTSNIRLVSWNMQKKSIPNWRADYGRLTAAKDLILLQEASLRVDTIEDLPTVPYWSFSPGYRTGDSVTGVLTLSSVMPLSRCSFTNTEPLLRTPKATSITQFALRGTDETLLVVNVHAVNFSLGLGTYKRQFQQIEDVLIGHAGPIILSGDLNTWRAGRVATIESLAADLELTELSFGADHRTRVFGLPIDHIYLRGFATATAVSSIVTSSDHNPIAVTLAM
ncbi:MAG TPA: endonuclease/exonuclease/phosphatase family protein [Woeseiaceae bacterium]|nr:endonuclease/exonuclease/phosphatase family protein [Woeseiaceae bacterium]